MATTLTINVSDEIEAAFKIAGIDVAATIEGIKNQAVQRAIQTHAKQLLDAFAQLPVDARERILAAVADELSKATTGGTLNAVGAQAVAAMTRGRGGI